MGGGDSGRFAYEIVTYKKIHNALDISIKNGIKDRKYEQCWCIVLYPKSMGSLDPSNRCNARSSEFVKSAKSKLQRIFASF